MLLALDIGTKRTGVACADRQTGIVFALDTIHHTSTDDLIEQVRTIIQQKKIDEIVVGDPLLLSGDIGTQSSYVSDVAKKLQEAVLINVHFIDERYTSYSHTPCKDSDAMSACTIADIALSRPKERV